MRCCARPIAARADFDSCLPRSSAGVTGVNEKIAGELIGDAVGRARPPGREQRRNAVRLGLAAVFQIRRSKPRSAWSNERGLFQRLEAEPGFDQVELARECRHWKQIECGFSSSSTSKSRTGKSSGRRW